MSRNHFKQMFAYDAWANSRALEMLRKLPHDHARARGLLAHVQAAQLVWMTRLRGNDSSQIALFPDQTLDECEAWIEHHREAYAAYLGAIDDGGLDQGITYKNMAGEQYTTPVREILTQVSNHGTYHRGQIALCVREAGSSPINTDFITFTRF